MYLQPITYKKYSEIDSDTRSELIQKYLEELSKVPKGERATKHAKGIRRSLRALGYFISKQSAHVIPTDLFIGVPEQK